MVPFPVSVVRAIAVNSKMDEIRISPRKLMSLGFVDARDMQTINSRTGPKIVTPAHQTVPTHGPIGACYVVCERACLISLTLALPHRTDRPVRQKHIDPFMPSTVLFSGSVTHS